MGGMAVLSPASPKGSITDFLEVGCDLSDLMAICSINLGDLPERELAEGSLLVLAGAEEPRRMEVQLTKPITNMYNIS
jgi:hypothetical protein